MAGSILVGSSLLGSFRSVATVQESMKSKTVDESRNATVTHHQSNPKLRKRRLRSLFGIFSMDSEKEYGLRQAHRGTYLSYFQDSSYKKDPMYPPNTLCTLREFLNNESLASDRGACRIVYTYVLGGGDPATRPTVCYWGDESCGGTLASNLVLPTPEYNFSALQEIEQYQDFTFLSVRENHKGGKTESWFTYAAALASERPELGIDIIGEIDSDTVVYPNRYLLDLRLLRKQIPVEETYMYGGVLVNKAKCSKKGWAFVCAHRKFQAPLFAPGYFVWISTPLAKHVFLNGTSLETKRLVHFPPHEDMSLANNVYSDPSITVETYNYFSKPVMSHAFKNPGPFLEEYWKRSGLNQTTTLKRRAQTNSSASRSATMLIEPVLLAAEREINTNTSNDQEQESKRLSPVMAKEPQLLDVEEQRNATKTNQHWHEARSRPFRFLLGVFSMDSEKEVALRKAHRETYILHFKYMQYLLEPEYPSNSLCTLREFLNNESLASDPNACLIIYTHVLGGGDPESRPTICYWGDESCGGTSSSNFVLPAPEYNFSKPEEIRSFQDFTFLSVRESHEDGKTESWFTYAAALAMERPELGIDFLGKIDSDTVFFPNRLLGEERTSLLNQPYVYGGWKIDKEKCSRKEWGKVCTNPSFHAPLFMPGGFVLLSVPLAQHVLLTGTSLETKRSAFLPNGEDMSLANVVYSDKSISIDTLDFSGRQVVAHPYKKRVAFVHRYWKYCGFNRTEARAYYKSNYKPFDSS